ncbi:unnamed protein product [Urochloa humidicola]
MAAPRPSAPPIYVLNDIVDLQRLTGDPGQGWIPIECASKKAYGCGENGQEAVEGLALYLRLGDAPLVTSSLAIRMSDKAHRWFDSELGSDELDPLYTETVKPETDFVGRILVAEADLIVVLFGFRRECSRERSYFLLYDNDDASLSMICNVPDPYQGIGPLLPVPRRTIRGGAWELLLMVRVPGRKKNGLQLGPSTILSMFSTMKWQSDRMPWHKRGMERPFPPGDLQSTATMAFSFQGKGFWADLAQGLMYCELPELNHAGHYSFSLIGLPAGCELDEDEMLELMEQPENVNRIVGCGGGNICFVCIDRATESEDDLVTMWTLQLPLKQWKEEWKFSARELWGFDGFKEAGLPKAPPEFPVVLADGSICFVLTDQRRSVGADVLVGHICSIDVPNKRVLRHGQVHDYHFSTAFVLPSSFFQRMHGSHKRKFGDYHPAAGLASLPF